MEWIFLGIKLFGSNIEFKALFYFFGGLLEKVKTRTKPPCRVLLKVLCAYCLIVDLRMKTTYF